MKLMPRFKLIRLIEKETRYESGDTLSNNILKSVRLLIHLFLFVIVLISAVVSKLAILFVTNESSHYEKDNTNHLNNDIWLWILILCVCSPYVISLFLCILKILFRQIPNPSYYSLLVELFFSTTSAIGTSMFIYGIFPQLDLARSILIMNGLSLIPSLLKFLIEFSIARNMNKLKETNKEMLNEETAIFQQEGSLDKILRKFRFQNNDKSKQVIYFIINFLSLIMQISIIPIVLATSYLLTSNWYLPVAIILVSLSSIRNYIEFNTINTIMTSDHDMKLSLRKKFHLFMFKLTENLRLAKINIDKSRHKIGLITNIWKIAIFLLFAHIFNNKFKFNSIASIGSKNQTTNLSSNNSLTSFMHNQPFYHLYPFIIQLVSTIVCYLAASLAFKLRMNRFCFALPMTLTTPVSLLIALLICELNTTNYQSIDKLKQNFMCSSESYFSYGLSWHLFVGVFVWWLSHLWITSRIWLNYKYLFNFSTIKRPFKFQFFNSVFIENSLMLDSFRYYEKVSDVESLRGNLNEDCESSNSSSSTNPSSNSSSSSSNSNNDPSLLYVCATIWHENDNEMLQLLKSLMRLDIHQFEQKNSIEKDPSSPIKLDYFDYEAHIFFDDAITCKESSSEPNEFCKNFIRLVQEAAMFAHKKYVELEKPIKLETPYGGRLVFKLPGGSNMIIHLKDKSKIRIKKRWSQVMYMYYLLGYKFFGDLDKMESFYQQNDLFGEYRCRNKTSKSKEFIGFGNFLKNIDKNLRKKLENTYILTLDGDVEFRPKAACLMIDKIKENKKIGSVCGRVHPIGAGPIVWYQIFEYAVGHWLQKVSEHIFGTVMCSPGCFSLLRASALLEDEILSVYATRSNKASHYVQYDQGEDRWLSTLIVQQGYYIVYCSAAASMTYSPETFSEYYNQRRRWIPSTMANLIEFITDYKHILNVNSRITFLYVLYIFINFIASLLGPATITLMIADTFYTSFEMNIWIAYIMTLLPIILFVIACFNLKNDQQIFIAAIISSVFALVMIFIIVGSASRILNSSIISPSSLILFSLIVIFLIAAICHPREFKCLFPGLLYFIALPSAFILLNIYAVINLNNISWGTRETKTSLQEENTINAKNNNAKSKKINLFKKYFKSLFVKSKDSSTNNKNSNQDLIIQNINDYLENIEKKLQLLTNNLPSKEDQNKDKEQAKTIVETEKWYENNVNEYETLNDINLNLWINDECLNNFKHEYLSKNETVFFNSLIQKYLYPIVESKSKKEQIVEDLKSLRNNSCFSFLMFNAFWIVLIFTLQLLKDKLRDKLYIQIAVESKNVTYYEPVSFVYVMLFVVVLFIQFFAMLWHRSITLIQLIRKTNLNIGKHPKILNKENSNKSSKSRLKKDLNMIKMESFDKICFEVNKAYELSSDLSDMNSEKIIISNSSEHSNKSDSVSSMAELTNIDFNKINSPSSLSPSGQTVKIKNNTNDDLNKTENGVCVV